MRFLRVSVEGVERVSVIQGVDVEVLLVFVLSCLDHLLNINK